MGKKRDEPKQDLVCRDREGKGLKRTHQGPKRWRTHAESKGKKKKRKKKKTGSALTRVWDREKNCRKRTGGVESFQKPVQGKERGEKGRKKKPQGRLCEQDKKNQQGWSPGYGKKQTVQGHKKNQRGKKLAIFAHLTWERQRMRRLLIGKGNGTANDDIKKNQGLEKKEKKGNDIYSLH